MQQLWEALPRATRPVCAPAVASSIPGLVPGAGSEPIQPCELGSGFSRYC